MLNKTKVNPSHTGETNIKVILSYDGTKYSGWQRLGERERNNSVQGVLEAVISGVLDEHIDVIGSGRTDAGVHAYGQVANFYTKSKVDLVSFMGEVNQKLPRDIQLLKLEKVSAAFHSRYDAIAKIYEYHIDTSEKPNVFTWKYMLCLPRQMEIDRMRQGAAYLVGKHDFKAFSSTMQDARETVKEIYAIEIKETQNGLVLSFEGNGFLYNMVRIMVGTLIEVGEGVRKPEDLIAILASKDRQKAGPTAPGVGLFLKQVTYKA